MWNFTLRDSPNDTINVSWWGTWDKALNLCSIFAIGDVGLFFGFSWLFLGFIGF